MQQNISLNKIPSNIWGLGLEWSQKTILEAGPGETITFSPNYDDPCTLSQADGSKFDFFRKSFLTVSDAINEKVGSDLGIQLGLPFAAIQFINAEKDPDPSRQRCFIQAASLKGSADAQDFDAYSENNPMGWRRAETFLSQFKQSFSASLAALFWCSNTPDINSVNICFMKEANGIYFIDFSGNTCIDDRPPYQEAPFKKDDYFECVPGGALDFWKEAISCDHVRYMQGDKIFDRQAFDQMAEIIADQPEHLIISTVQRAQNDVIAIMERDGFSPEQANVNIDVYCAELAKALLKRQKQLPEIAHRSIGPRHYPLAVP
ncbi:MAG: hypothetical protein WAO98_05595 [Alphaproteobacteria bacterium]